MIVRLLGFCPPIVSAHCRHVVNQQWCQKSGFYNFRVIRRQFFHQSKIQNVSHRTSKETIKKCSVFWKLSAGVAASAGLRLWCGAQVFCLGDATGTELVRDKVQEAKFDWPKFLDMLWPHLWHLLAAVGGALVVALLNIKIPLVLGDIINVISNMIRSEGSFALSKELGKPLRHLMSMYVAQAIFTFFYISLLSLIGERVAARMRQDLFASVMCQDIAYFDSHRSGEIMNRLTVDVQEFKSSFKLCVSHGLRSFTQVTGCVVSLFIISPVMAGGLLIVVPSIVLVGTIVGSFLRHLSREAQAQVSKATAVGDEAINNIRTVRAFAAEKRECSVYAHETEEAAKLNELLGVGIGLFQGGTNLFLNGLVLGTLYGGSCLMVSKQINAGDLMAFLVAAQTIQRSLAQLSMLFGHVVRGMSAGARVFEIINSEPTIPIAGGKFIPYHSLMADVEFKDVSFAYPTRPQQKILKNFNLKLASGSTVAVVGTSGNGKSTIAALLERFYDVQNGSITIDGVDIRELDPAWLRGSAIGYINQEPVLFASTITENIRYGSPEATDEMVMEVAKLANAHDFISNFPEGYNTVLGERGVTVSGGQRQRIAIARAILKNPSILILDEATSALDTESERIVQSALEKLTKGRTVLVIAHRLSTVQNADIIVVLNKGVIVEMGTHAVLTRKKGCYWNLMQQQQQEENTSQSL